MTIVTIGIFNGCEVLIENSVTRVTVWHHEWQNFQFAPKNHYGLFFLHTLPSTIAFRLEYVLFYQFYAKITTFFDQEKWVRLLSYTLTSKRLAETDVKVMSRRQKWRQNRHTDVMHENLSYTPHCKTTFPSPGRVHGNPGLVCKKRCSCWHKNFVPKGLSAPVPGLYTCIKSWKKLYKIRFQRDICLKLVANDRSDKRFLLTSKFCPLGLSDPDLQLSTFIKSWKDVYKVRGWRDSF